MRLLFSQIIKVLIFFYIINAGILFSQPGEEEQQVNIFTEGNQLNLTLDSDKTGDFIIAWESDSQDNGLPGIYACRYYKTGLPKEDVFKVNTSWAPHNRPAIAVGSQGNFIVTWENYWIENPTSSGIAARVFDQEGHSLGQEFLVNEYTSDFQGEPDTATSSTGDFVITWQSWGQDGDGFGIFARIFNQNGIPLGTEFQVNSYTSDNQQHPAIVMDKYGYFVITWSSFGQDGDKTGIMARRFNRYGEATDQEFRVHLSSESWQEWPAIAMDKWSNFVICWHSYQENSQSYDIFARTFNETANLKGPEFQVNSYSDNWQVFPAIDADSEGNFIITWQSLEQDSRSFGIYAQLFDKNGQSLGPEFQVNSTTIGSQEAPDIYMISPKNFGIAWQSQQNEETGWDLFYKAYAPQLPISNPVYIKYERKHDSKKNIHLPCCNIYRDSTVGR